MGVQPRKLVRDLPVGLDWLRNPRNRVDWDTFALLMDRASEQVGLEGMERMGGMLFEAPSFRYLTLAAGVLVTPEQALKITDRVVGPSLFPSLHHRLEALPDGRWRLSLEVPRGLRVSTAYFASVKGNLRALPRFCGRDEARVVATVDGARASFDVELPRERFAERTRRFAALLRHPRRLVRTVLEQRRSLQAGYEALARFRQDFHTVIERLPDGVAILRGGMVLYANRALLRQLGYERLAELAGRPVSHFLPAGEKQRLQRWLADMDVAPSELQLVRKDGRLATFEAQPVQVIDFDGEPANLVVVRDVTERKRLQQQLMLSDRMASLGTLAAGVAHEVNNPLAYAHISLQTLERRLTELEQGIGPSPQLEDMRETLEAAGHGLQRVRTIVGDLRTFSRPDDETVEPVDLHRVLESAVSMAAKELRHRARLVRDYGDVPQVLGNDARLGQVFLNLLVNATQAFPEGNRRRNEVRLTTHAEADESVTVEVRDNGPGIPSDILEHVFLPFVTTKPAGVGTGLGLSICHRIVTKLGGEIAVESDPEQGTTVRVTLPAAEPRQPSSQPPARDGGSADRGRILVVDDEPILLSTLRTLLEPHHDVETVDNGQAALERIRTERFDVVLCDLMMSDVTGMDVFERVRELRPGLEERIVFMTGGAFTNATRRFLTQVNNPCLDKPFSAEDVLELIQQRLGAAASSPRDT